MMLRGSVALALLVAVSACGSKSQVGVSSGNSYSTTPCADNCGQDAQCQANCTNVNNQSPLPPGVQAGGSK